MKTDSARGSDLWSVLHSSQQSSPPDFAQSTDERSEAESPLHSHCIYTIYRAYINYRASIHLASQTLKSSLCMRVWLEVDNKIQMETYGCRDEVGSPVEPSLSLTSSIFDFLIFPRSFYPPHAPRDRAIARANVTMTYCHMTFVDYCSCVSKEKMAAFFQHMIPREVRRQIIV